MKIAVTGASGYFGNNLCRALIAENYDVRVLIHKNTQALEGLPLTKLHGDILDLSSLKSFFSGVDIVFHLAAKISINGDPDGSVMQTNVEGTRNVVQACLACGVKRLIHVSSIHALEQEPLDVEVDESRPFIGVEGFLHDRSKSLAEREVMKGIEKGLDAVILNPTSLIGPFDYAPSLMGNVLINLYQQRLPSLVQGGFNWVDVRDVVQSALNAIKRGKKGERYLLAGHWKTVKEISEAAAQITGKPAPKFTFPIWFTRACLPLARAYSRLRGIPLFYTEESLDILLRANRNINSSKAQEELGHSPRPLEETLADAYASFRQRGVIR